MRVRRPAEEAMKETNGFIFSISLCRGFVSRFHCGRGMKSCR
jgi:hypothetical protein